MATTYVPRSFESFLPHHSTDNKLPITTEQPVDDLAQQVADILSTNIKNDGINSPVHLQSHEKDAKNTTVGAISLVAPLPKLDDKPSVTPEVSLPTTPEQSLPSTPDVYSPSISSTLTSDDSFNLSERPFGRLALQILDIIARYGHNNGSGSGVNWTGKNKFLPLVERSIEHSAPIKMVLPAFPCKSINKVDKVLGTLPDLGEELAFMHLNGMCESIVEIYEHGAEIVVASDGLVYNGKSSLCL